MVRYGNYILYYNKGYKNGEGELIEFTSSGENYKTKAECEAMEGTKVSKVIFDAPNAFMFSITPVHYIVMSIFVLGVGGYFVYRFIALDKQYKKIKEDFEKTGTIEF